MSLPAPWAGLGVIAVLLLWKMLAKLAGVIPLARVNYMGMREATYTALLMATGITFGTIAALFGLQNRIIDQRQYTLLVTAVILSAIVPTLIAQKFFQPTLDAMRVWGQRYRTRGKVVTEEDLRQMRLADSSLSEAE